MADNLEPINIDINMRQNVSEESERASQGMDSLASRSSIALSAIEKDTTRQIDIIRQMTSVVDELQKQMSDNPDLFSSDQLSRLNSARQSIASTQSQLESYISSYSSMSEAINQGADITDLMSQRTQDLSETEETLRDAMAEILDTQSEVNEAMDENSDITDSNTQSTTGNTVANQLMSTAIKEICSALGIENTAIVNTISNTRTITTAKSLWANATRILNTQLGISIALSKLLMATGIGLLIAGIAAVVYAYNDWDEATQNQKIAQDQLNRILEESAQKKSDLESQTKSLISTINSETKTIEEKILAYKELQNLYPKILSNLDMQTFKIMGATEQQKLLNEAIYGMGVNQMDDELTKYKKQLKNLNGDSFIKSRWSQFEARSLLGHGFKEYATSGFFDVQDQISAMVDLLEKQKQKQEEIAREAEFLKKPESERREILVAQLEELEKQSEAFDQSTNATQSLNSATDKTNENMSVLRDKSDKITDSISKWGEQPNALKNIFSGANLEASVLITRIATIKNQINQIDGVSSTEVVRNKEFFDKQVKDFKALETSIDSKTLAKLKAGKNIVPSQMITSPEEYQRLKSIQEDYIKKGKLAKDAEEELKVYNPEKKSSSSSKKNTTEDKLKKANDDLAKKTVEYQNKIDASRVAAMKEGAEKQRAEIKAEYDKEKSIIEQELKEIEKLEERAKRPATAERENLKELELKVGAKYDADNTALDEALKKQLDDVMDDVNSRFNSELDNNLKEVDKYYDEQIKKAEKAIEDVDKTIIATQMKDLVKSGNVDLLARPIIDAAELVKKGWEDAGEGIATVFSSQFGILDETDQEIEILVTPILPDGKVLTPQELGDYVNDVLQGNNILDADKLGIVIGVDVDKDGEVGEKLHLLQEQYYQTSQKIEITDQLNAHRAKSRFLVNMEFSQKQIDFDTEVALRREALSKKTYLFEADRQKAILKINRDAQEKTLNNLKDQYNKKPTKELAKEIELATIALDEFDQGLENLKTDKLKQVASYIAEIADTINPLFQEDGAFSNETLEQLTSTAGNIAQGFASGGVVGGAFATAGEAVSFLNSAFSANKRHQEALKVLLQAKIAMQREYNQLLLEEQLKYKLGTSIFGTDTIGKVVNSIEVYRKAMQSYKEELQGSFTPNEAYEKGLEKQSGKGGLMSGYFDKKLTEYRKQLDLYNKGVGALYDAEIVTGHKKTGMFGWGKGKDTYSKILDVYPDVIDAEGKLNKERVQSILDTRKMNDETRNLLQTLLDLEEQAESAQQEMQSLLESTFGSLGSSLSTAIVDAFASGNDALFSWRDNVTDVLNKFAEQMVYSQFLSKIFTGLQSDIEDTYNQLADGALTEQDLSKEVTDLLGGFFGGLGSTVEQSNQFLEEFWKNAEQAGFKRPEADRTGASKGIATASQDSINEVNGGMYALRQQLGDVRNLEKESLAYQKTQQASLDRIAENTEYCRYIKDVKDSLEDIQTRGIKVKV